LLSRLKNAGLLSYNWQESPSGPPRKYFQITEMGRGVLQQLTENWSDLVTAVSHTTSQNTKTA
jgi:PadR family transcriptional regulator PadR